MLIVEGKLQSEVDRILHSEQLRSSEVLRRLLRFLADKTAAGEADQLKEYAVAIDGLGKPPSYDPRHNSAVRIQVGRLRLKLAEYYRNEGKDDDFIIDLPKGRFKLTCEQRPVQEELPPLARLEPSQPKPAEARGSGLLLFLLGACLAILISLSVSYFLRPWPIMAGARNSATVPGWTPDLQELWGRFVDSNQPLVLIIEDPLFVELKSNPGIYYRDKSLNQWKDVAASPAVAALRSVLKSPTIQPSLYYTAFGEVDISFLFGRMLGPRVQNFSIAKSSQISWQQLADNNVLFVGVQNLFFDEQLHGMPMEPQLVPVPDGIENVHPQAGEPTLFSDRYSTAPSEEGMVYALVTHIPGPLRSNEVESFTSGRSAGYVGAVQWFTNPNFAHRLIAHLKAASGGQMPRYYQVLLKVKFKDDVPTETTYVLSRELR